MTTSDNERIAQSHRAVWRIAKRSGSNFYRTFRLLPRPKRKAMFALYSFARITDDLGDCEEPVSVRRQWLDLWRKTTAMNLLSGTAGGVKLVSELERLDSTTRETLTRHATDIMPALCDAVNRYEIPSRYFLEIIDGVLADQQKNRFDTFEQLEHYCYLVASAVGIACLYIWEFESPLPEQAAIDCGLAFQLTNILRDVSEDAARGRIYLPRQHYEQHGLDEDDLLNPRRDARLRCLIVDEAQRADQLFQSGWQIWDSLSEDGRPMFSMMWRTYRQLLQKIMDHPDDIVHKRISLNAWERLGLISRHFIRPLYHRLPVPPLEVRPSVVRR